MPRTPRHSTSAALRALLPLGPAVLLAACADQTLVAPAGDASLARAGGGATTALVPARYVVQFAATAEPALSAAALAASGGRLAGAVPAARGLVLEHVSNPAALRTQPGVLRVEESAEITLDATRPEGAGANLASPFATGGPVAAAVDPGTVPWLASGVQWDLKRMSVPEAWALSKQGEGASVCIIDSGGDAAHQELSGQIAASTSFVPNDPAAVPDLSKGYSPAALDSNGHGSHVSGTVAAKGQVMAGVAPRSKLLIAKVFARTGGTPTDRVVNAIQWCTDNGADVVNMSLGGTRFKNTPSNVANIVFYQTGIDYALSRGVVVVASAGNNNFPQPNALVTFAPGFNAGVINVGSTGPWSRFPLTAQIPNWDPMNPAVVWRNADSRAYYSNYGTAVKLFAPGGNLSANLNWPDRIVNGVIQGVDLDGVYSVCSGPSRQTGFALNNNGSLTYPGGPCTGTNGYISYQGTSMAAPHVAGLMALLTAEIGGERTAARRARVEACVTKSTDNIGPSTVFGGGRVNALKAIQLLRQNGC